MRRLQLSSFVSRSNFWKHQAKWLHHLFLGSPWKKKAQKTTGVTGLVETFASVWSLFVLLRNYEYPTDFCELETFRRVCHVLNSCISCWTCSYSRALDSLGSWEMIHSFQIHLAYLAWRFLWGQLRRIVKQRRPFVSARLKIIWRSLKNLRHRSGNCSTAPCPV
jgi:hypothetical protein